MTCIIAFKHKEFGTVIAGDKMGSSHFTKHIIKDPKVFRKEDFMVGYTTSFRMGQLIEYMWDVPNREVKQSSRQYLHVSVVASLKKCFADNGFGEKDKNLWGNFILCYEDMILEIQDDMSILEHETDIVCIGSGKYHAEGAMLALMDYEIDVKAILEKTFKIVSYNIASVSEKFDYLTGKPKEKAK